MRLHTKLPPAALYNALRGLNDVWLDTCQIRGSRTHARAFEVQLRGDGVRHTRWPNPGQPGGIDYSGGKAATRDDWGHWFAALYELDPSMRTPDYSSRSDFHVKTAHRYSPNRVHA